MHITYQAVDVSATALPFRKRETFVRRDKNKAEGTGRREGEDTRSGRKTASGRAGGSSSILP
jgi:hypothetical protein